MIFKVPQQAGCGFREQPGARALPHCEGGFFYGHQFQDEAAAEYRERDLEFCAWARERIRAGETVIYSCWW